MIPLAQLRSAIGVVPQEPMIIGGLTIAQVRLCVNIHHCCSCTGICLLSLQNIDPLEEYPEAALWEALEECSLAAVVRALPAGLETPFSSGGSNWSVGNRMQLCFARILLRRPRIILLDEATASLDEASDAVILRAIVALSRSSTILNIAHRLNTGISAEAMSRIRRREDYVLVLPFSCSYAHGPHSHPR